MKVRDDKIFDGDGKAVEQYFGFGEDVLAVADRTVVSLRDGMPDPTPFVLITPKSTSDYGGDNVMVEIAPNVFAWYAHLHEGSIAVKVGDAVKAGTPMGGLGNTGPSEGPIFTWVFWTTGPYRDGACRSSSTASPWSAQSSRARRRRSSSCSLPDSRQVRLPPVRWAAQSSISHRQK